MNRLRLAFLSAGLALALAGPALAQADPHDAAVAHAKAAPSIALSVAAAGKTANFTLADLKAMPQKTVTVHNAHRSADETYTGVLLTDVLTKAGVTLGKPLLRSYIKAEGTDRYWVLYSGIEIEAASHLGDTLVATTLDGKPLGDNGAFMLVSTEDRKPQRCVRNLASLALVQLP